MHDKLLTIIQRKKQEIILLKKKNTLAEAEFLPKKKSLKSALLRSEYIKIIAEIKRRSPVKGLLAAISDPIHLARQYAEGGAAAISVLTDSNFGGDLKDLQTISTALADTSIPILRKDFLLDPIQIYEAKKYGADAVLLIAGILGDNLATMLQTVQKLNLEALVEIHTHDELHLAMDAGAELIGINNRNLQTFQVNTQHALQLITHLPTSIIAVAESGITQPELTQQYYNAGFSAVLVGEALVKSSDPKHWIRACRGS